jgi:hypothetical protein
MQKCVAAQFQRPVGTVTATEFRQSLSFTKFYIFLTSHWIFDMDATDGILIFIVRDRISVTKIFNVTHNDNKA